MPLVSSKDLSEQQKSKKSTYQKRSKKIKEKLNNRNENSLESRNVCKSDQDDVEVKNNPVKINEFVLGKHAEKSSPKNLTAVKFIPSAKFSLNLSSTSLTDSGSDEDLPSITSRPLKDEMDALSSRVQKDLDVSNVLTSSGSDEDILSITSRPLQCKVDSLSSRVRGDHVVSTVLAISGSDEDIPSITSRPLRRKVDSLSSRVRGDHGVSTVLAISERMKTYHQ